MVASFEAGPSLAWDSGRSTALAVTARVGLDLGRFGAVLETRIPFAELSDVALSTGTRSAPRREILLGVRGRGWVATGAVAATALLAAILASFSDNVFGS
jgi:hypothetical protein